MEDEDSNLAFFDGDEAECGEWGGVEMMTQAEAEKIADEFIAALWWMNAERAGVRPPSRGARDWTVLYKRVGEGPVVVVVDPETRAARILLSR